MSSIAQPLPALSPLFANARKLSRFMGMIFTIGFWLMLFVLGANFVTAIFPQPDIGTGLEHGIRIPGNLRGWPALGALAAANLVLVPDILILHNARKLFFCFARGEVFTAPPIAHLRAAGLWLTASFFTGIAAVYLLQLCGLKNAFFPAHLHFPGALPGLLLEFGGDLLAGIAAIIAAYVMEEARRVAAENAEIV